MPATFGKRQPTPSTPVSKPARVPTYVELLGTPKDDETARTQSEFVNWYVNPLRLTPIYYLAWSIGGFMIFLMIVGSFGNHASNQGLAAGDRTCEVIYGHTGMGDECKRNNRYILTGKR